MNNQRPSEKSATDTPLREQLVAACDETAEARRELEASYNEAVRDSSVHQEEQDSLRQLLEQSRSHHELAEAALARHDAGDYGTCVECSAAIPSERLAALPEAITCVACAS